MKERQSQIAALLVLLVASIPSVAQRQGAKSQSAASSSRSVSNATTREQPSGAPHEGIKVHGHWTIVVRNADGSVASRNEFENALTSGGAQALVSLLTQAQSTAPVWSIAINGNTGPGQNLGFRASASMQGVNGTVVLTASQKINTPNASTFQLTDVDSDVNLTSLASTFTSRDLTQPIPPSTTAPGPIAVQSGQTVDATVVLSFS